MKCSRIREKLLEYEDTVLPADLQRHLDQCADCAKHYRQMRELKALLATQNDVAPSPGFEARLIAEVGRRIRALDEKPEPVWGRFLDFVFGTPVPAYRYALAAALILLVGAHVYNLTNSSPTAPFASPQPSVTVAAAPAVPAPVTNTPHAEFASGQNVIGPLRIMTNGGPGRVEYGPLPSTLVNFEY